MLLLLLLGALPSPGGATAIHIAIAIVLQMVYVLTVYNKNDKQHRIRVLMLV